MVRRKRRLKAVGKRGQGEKTERYEEAEKNLVGRQRWQDAVAITVKDTFYYEGDLNYFFQDPNAEIVAEYTEKDRQFLEAERKAEKSG